MQETETPRKTSCRTPSVWLTPQMLSSPSDDSTATATSTGQLVAMPSCCNSLFIATERPARPDRDTVPAPELSAPIIRSLGRNFYVFRAVYLCNPVCCA